MKKFRSLSPALLLLALLIPAVVSCSPAPPPSPQLYTYEIINTCAHDPAAFTQGLVYAGGSLYESTGLYGRSSLRRVDLSTGEVLQIHELPAEYFGEGLTVFDDSAVQITWKNHTGFVYHRESFELIDRFSYPTEGWGLTHDGARLIMSDGTSTLHFLDPQTFDITGTLEVTDSGVPVKNINELEYVDGSIYANIWQTDRIAVISPQDGRVTGWIDLSGLLQTQNFTGKVDVLNGIAYDAENDRLFVTGKLWPYLFEIKLSLLHPQ